MNTTLESFDSIIPDYVFKDVTSITVDQFRLLRDGGDVTDPETGEKEHFDGHLFDSVRLQRFDCGVHSSAQQTRRLFR